MSKTSINNQIFRVFNLTFGKVIRLFQKSLISQKHQGVFYFMDQQALRDSAMYALRNFSMFKSLTNASTGKGDNS